MRPDFTARLVTLREVYALARKLAGMIMEEGISFDLVVAVARGGMLPARLLCDFLNIKRLSSVQVRHYAAGAEQMEEAEIIDPVGSEIIRGRKVLLVDDVNDSGKTLKAALEHMHEFQPELVKTAVLHEKENDLFEADFKVEELKEWKWLMYQWAATEDIIEFLKKDGMLDKDEEIARKHLEEQYGLRVESGFLQHILEMRQNYNG